MHEFEQSAFLLHSRPYREHQQLVELLTENEGKVSAVAYVSHSQKSNKKGLLQPFLPLRIVLKGKSNLRNLSRVESSGKAFTLTGNHLYSAFYLNELLVKLLGEHVVCARLFHQYQESLTALANNHSIERVLREFELYLLDELGQAFDFTAVFEIESPTVYYVLEEGFIPAINKMPLPCFDITHIQAIARQELACEYVQQSYKILMRQVFSQLLGGKPLNSRKLFTK